MLHTPAVFPRLIIADLGDATTYDTLLMTVPRANPGRIRRRYDSFGTPSYSSPEILGENSGVWHHAGDITKDARGMFARNWIETDKAADVWALGSRSFLHWTEDEAKHVALLWKSLTGEHPYENISLQPPKRTAGKSKTRFVRDSTARGPTFTCFQDMGLSLDSEDEMEGVENGLLHAGLSVSGTDDGKDEGSWAACRSNGFQTTMESGAWHVEVDKSQTREVGIPRIQAEKKLATPLFLPLSSSDGSIQLQSEEEGGEEGEEEEEEETAAIFETKDHDRQGDPRRQYFGTSRTIADHCFSDAILEERARQYDAFTDYEAKCVEYLQSRDYDAEHEDAEDEADNDVDEDSAKRRKLLKKIELFQVSNIQAFARP